jgi:hypothetical protein
VGTGLRGIACAGEGVGVAFEATTGLRPLVERVRLGVVTTWVPCTSSGVGAQYGSLVLTGVEGATVV